MVKQSTVQQTPQMAPPAANSATINLKWNHRGTYHRFEIPREAGCSTLMKRITAIFPNFYGQIGWKDEDGDTVIISSDEELLHAASLPQNQQLLRLFTIEKTTDEVESVDKANNDDVNQKANEKREANGVTPNNGRREQLSSEIHSGSRRFLLMAQEQLLNTQKLFRKSIRSSSSGSQLSIKSNSSAVNNTTVKNEKRGKGSDTFKVNAASKVTGTQPNLKAMLSVAKRKITGSKSKKVSVNSDNKPNYAKDDGKTACAAAAAGSNAVEASAQIHDQTNMGKNDVEYSDKSVSSDSDIEIIEKTDNGTTNEHDDWTLINCSSGVQETHLN